MALELFGAAKSLGRLLHILSYTRSCVVSPRQASSALTAGNQRALQLLDSLFGPHWGQMAELVLMHFQIMLAPEL